MPQKKKSKSKRAIVYIDGFNLYYGLRQSFAETNSSQKSLTKRCYWLDVQKLAENLIQHCELVKVKYFTARIKGDTNKQARQTAFLSAIRYQGKKLQIIEGRYASREMMCASCHKVSSDVVCPSCKHHNNLLEEKKTDVNIASQMLQDAYTDKFDVAFLISADSDLVPPIEIIRSMNPPKRVNIVFPPNTFSQELKDKSDHSQQLSPKMIKKSLLPEEIVNSDGWKLVIPERWK